MQGYHIYRDNQRQYRWYYSASNGKTISVSSEAYVHKSDCQRSVQIMQTEAASAPVYDATGEHVSSYR
jgi:uncharacterized protein YegP (UPF0339 family)